MSTDDFKNCMTGEYNADAEAVEFIVQIYQLGGEEAIKWIKDNWEKFAAAAGIAAAIAKYAPTSVVVQYLQRILPAAAAAAVDVIVAMILGLALGAILLAIEAAISCMPRLAQ